MSLNITVLCQQFVVCVSDRRLTANGKIVTERSTKLTLIRCADGSAFVTYNGIGTDHHGRSPADWLQQLADAVPLGQKPLGAVANRIKLDTQARIDALPDYYRDRRHSFVIGGFVRGRAALFLVSNYESLDCNGSKIEADSKFSVQTRIAGPRGVAAILTGATDTLPHERGRALCLAVRSGKSAIAIKSQAVKLIKDTSYRAHRRGTVGTSVTWGILGPNGHAQVDNEIVGGSSLLELPGLISENVQFKDVFVEVASPSSESGGRYDSELGRFKIAESKCSACGSPFPEGYTRCGVCDSTR